MKFYGKNIQVVLPRSTKTPKHRVYMVENETNGNRWYINIYGKIISLHIYGDDFLNMELICIPQAIPNINNNTLLMMHNIYIIKVSFIQID